MKSMSFKTLLMRSKAYVLIGFLGDFVCPFSKGEELWAKTSLKYGIYWSGTVSAISGQMKRPIRGWWEGTGGSDQNVLEQCSGLHCSERS